ncbi:MAG TPA: S8/S53 family peptidase, partial [Candidatus Thermoplasmatota archaeon]|nr:S8/S53 family peptidase [Candidatus Thermoplasmatota archaeon]
LGAALAAGCSEAPKASPIDPPRPSAGAATDDVVVIAVVDSGFNPYHFDFRASLMPQHRNADPGDDLPLDQDPATWLPGFDPSAFASYDRMDLTLSDDPDARSADLHAKDSRQWAKMQRSGGGDVHLRWIPGTKVIGAVTFGSGDGFAPGSHGVGSSSVSVGNLHGTCPNCLLVFVHGMGEEANRWVEQQDWIDAQTNSWGFSSSVVGRERVYAHSDTESQRKAVERGQSIFFSAGNGVDGAFVASNPTLFSSQEGPDWITTVGAISPDGSSPGHGKPADVAAPGSRYLSAYGSQTINGTGYFGGTSNATPVTTGLYGEALYQIRRELAGPSRVQRDGTIAVGPAGCAEANAECALADGELTVHELRQALFRSARHTPEGWNIGGATGPLPQTDNRAELTFLAEGHGSFWGRMGGEDNHRDEVSRITGFARGEWFEEQDADLHAWFVADSLCRQGGWGAWSHGYAPDRQGTVAPHPEWPVRTWMSSVCPEFLGAVVLLEKQVPYAGDLLP